MEWQYRTQVWLDENERAQSWLAGRAGITRQHLSLLMRGERVPRPSVLHALESAMGMAHGWLTSDDMGGGRHG